MSYGEITRRNETELREVRKQRRRRRRRKKGKSLARSQTRGFSMGIVLPVSRYFVAPP